MDTDTRLPRLYDFDQAGAVVGRTGKAMRQLRARGRGPRFRNVDGKLLTTEAELARWIASNFETDNPDK
jgi:hypothetical protein